MGVLQAFLTTPAVAQNKHAFSVGINQYDNLPYAAQLKKAVGDANTVADVLRGLGFKVRVASDLTRSQFNQRWQDFLSTIAPGDTVAFTFSGHGVEINGMNYLLPRDIPAIRSGRDELLKREALSLHEIMSDLRERKVGFSFLIIDACRDNPFVDGTRSVGGARGLARIDPPQGTFVIFSPGAHQTALDRLSDNDNVPTSVFTRSLIPQLRAKCLSLLDMTDLVAEHVRDLAGTVSHRQTPAFYSGVVGARRVHFAGCENVTERREPVPPLPPTPLPRTQTYAGEWLVTTRWTDKCTNPGRSMIINVDAAGRITDLWRLGPDGRRSNSIKGNIRTGVVSERGNGTFSYELVARAGDEPHVNILEGEIGTGTGHVRSERRNGAPVGCPGYFSISKIK